MEYLSRYSSIVKEWDAIIRNVGKDQEKTG